MSTLQYALQESYIYWRVCSMQISGGLPHVVPSGLRLIQVINHFLYMYNTLYTIVETRVKIQVRKIEQKDDPIQIVSQSHHEKFDLCILNCKAM